MGFSKHEMYMLFELFFSNNYLKAFQFKALTDQDYDI